MHMKRLFAASAFLLVAFFGPASADGTVNGGACYNGWHEKYFRCHPPHQEEIRVCAFDLISEEKRCFDTRLDCETILAEDGWYASCRNAWFWE